MRPAVAAVVACALACGCAHTLDRAVSLGPATSASIRDVPVAGAFVHVDRVRGGSLEGELIAVEDATIVLDTGVVPFADVAAVKLDAYENEGDVTAQAGLGGAIIASTFAHGWYLILTAPAAMLGTVTAAGATALSNDRSLGRRVAVLRQYARFPQGSPGRVHAHVDLGHGPLLLGPRMPPCAAGDERAACLPASPAGVPDAAPWDQLDDAPPPVVPPP